MAGEAGGTLSKPFFFRFARKVTGRFTLPSQTTLLSFMLANRVLLSTGGFGRE